MYYPISYRRPTVSNILIRNINATNIQENTPTQNNDQTASSSGGGWRRRYYGGGTATNTADQTTRNWQGGNATNNINVRTRATRANITINGVNATNVQSNTPTQSSWQGAFGTGRATNTVWQNSSNDQSGSATNNINIYA